MTDETYKFAPGDIEATRSLAFLSYLSFLFLVPMLINRDSPFTKFHVNQGILLTIIWIIYGVASSIIHAIFVFIPIIGSIVNILVGFISIIPIALCIVGIVNVLQGKAVRLPVIGNIDIYR